MRRHRSPASDHASMSTPEEPLWALSCGLVMVGPMSTGNILHAFLLRVIVGSPLRVGHAERCEAH